MLNIFKNYEIYSTIEKFNRPINKIVDYFIKNMDEEFCTRIKKSYKKIEYVYLTPSNKKESEKYPFIFPGEGGTLIDRFRFPKNTLCIVSRGKNLEFTKETIFHELMHIASTKLEEENYEIDTGIMTANEVILSINKDYEEELTLLNESLTELISAIIYQEIYNKEYKYISEQYLKGYTFLNELEYLKNNPNILFEIYFKNNPNLFKVVLEEKCNIKYEDVIRQFMYF